MANGRSQRVDSARPSSGRAPRTFTLRPAAGAVRRRRLVLVRRRRRADGRRARGGDLGRRRARRPGRRRHRDHRHHHDEPARLLRRSCSPRSASDDDVARRPRRGARHRAGHQEGRRRRRTSPRRRGRARRQAPGHRAGQHGRLRRLRPRPARDARGRPVDVRDVHGRRRGLRAREHRARGHLRRPVPHARRSSAATCSACTRKSRLHSFGEIINRYRFWWHVAAARSSTDWDFAGRNLRSARWLHRRIDVDFNGWFMCLIPTEVLRTIGLSLPLFIKWDDSEYGVRAGAGRASPRSRCPAPRSGTCRGPTRTTRWTGRPTSTSATAPSRRCCTRPTSTAAGWSGRASTTRSSTCSRMQYSTAELRHLALEDVLAGPERLHADLPTKLPELAGQAQAVRRRADLARPRRVPAGAPREAAEARPGPDAAEGQGRPAASPRHQRGPPGRGRSGRSPRESPRGAARRHGRQVVDDRAVRLRWSSRCPTAPARRGTSATRTSSRDLLRRTVEIHQRLYREWPRAGPALPRRRCPTSSRPSSGRKTFETARRERRPEAP